ncbi:CBS domain-containing protein [Actinoallomurus acaciae]|uniref:CBS domain-containing protein n=1 Tax=Actinoallomurus acaciae TaxID=502577 RepID=A0ABV5Y8M0_9ACTN
MSPTLVRDYMTTDVVILRPGDAFKEIVRALADRGVSGAPVVEETGRVMGVVTEADLLHKEAFTPVAEEPRRYFASRSSTRVAQTKAAGDTATDLMSAPAITVDAEAPIARAARLMAVHGFKRLPVVGDDGALVGIISRADVVGVFLAPDDELRRQVVADVVERCLWENPERIRVQVRNGVVTLSGRLASKSLIPLTVALTRSIDGVVDVVDELSYDRDDMTSDRPEAWRCS